MTYLESMRFPKQFDIYNMIFGVFVAMTTHFVAPAGLWITMVAVRLNQFLFEFPMQTSQRDYMCVVCVQN